MNKEESLSFLQSCIDKVNLATAQDIQFYREMYDKDCAMRDATPEEQKSVYDYIKSISKPTGVNFWNLI